MANKINFKKESSIKNIGVKRGDIFKLDVSNITTAYNEDRQKICLVISNNRGNYYSSTIIGIIGEQRNIEGNSQYYFDLNMITTLDKRRLNSYICRYSNSKMKHLDNLVKKKILSETGERAIKDVI
ncbi:type II toxin-antitoxin system PemK/MazF family toxin [Rossellomorea vietnamensis]|uniref:type II toxin-antitoxin system PemK/MazF family toxin n=1 Tax=Rossellomorea vietnamensis TaxID=218284 RepID=UPI003CF4BBCD